MVGIADVFPDRAKAILAKRQAGKGKAIYEGCQVYGGHAEMLEKAKLDVVIIGTAPLHR